MCPSVIWKALCCLEREKNIGSSKQPGWEMDSNKGDEVMYYLASAQIYSNDLKQIFDMNTRIDKLRLMTQGKKGHYHMRCLSY